MAALWIAPDNTVGGFVDGRPVQTGALQVRTHGGDIHLHVPLVQGVDHRLQIRTGARDQNH